MSGQFQRHACTNAGLDFLIYVHTLLTIPFYISCYGHTQWHYLLLICLCIIIIMVDSFTNHSLILFLVCVSYGRLFHKSLTDHLHCFFPTHCSCKILHVRRIDSHNTTYSSVYVLYYKLSHTLFWLNISSVHSPFTCIILHVKLPSNLHKSCKNLVGACQDSCMIYTQHGSCIYPKWVL